MASGWRTGELSGLALLVSGTILVGATIGGYYVGVLTDRVLHTEPLGAIIGLLVGFVIGVIDLYRVGMRIMQTQPAPAPLPADDDADTDTDTDTDTESL
jgi:F0F1-type ATP synthase assembly protein I